MKRTILALIFALFAAPATAQTTVYISPVPTATVGGVLQCTAVTGSVCTAWAFTTAGSGTITGSGTSGTLAKFTASGAIGNSIITESGATASVAGTFSVTQLILRGSTSGTLNVKCPATCSSTTLTLPAGTTDFSATGGTGQVIRQSSAGAAFTVATLASTDLSDTANIPLLNAANVFSSATGQSVKKLLLPGSSSGTLTVVAAAAAGSNTLTLPAGTTDFSATGAGYVYQASAGAAFTVSAALLPTTIVGSDATDASSSITGAFKTAGGLGVAKKLFVGTGINLASLTASQVVFTDASKNLVSNAITGTGNVVMSASPTLTGTIDGAAMTLSSTLVVTGKVTATAAGIDVPTSGAPGMVFSGTYTPTVAGVTNVAASTAAVCWYTRIGNIVIIGGKVTVDPTASGTLTEFSLTLPIASTFTLPTDVSGAGATDDTASQAVVFDRLASGSLIRGYWKPSSAANQEMRFTLVYVVK